MKKLLVSIICATLMITTHMAIAGPFGLTMGMTLKQIDSKAKKIAPGKFIITNVPKPHSAFETYVVQVSDNSGLCWVKAIGKDISTSSYGLELKSAFNDMNGKLTNVYGKGKKTDFLMSGSIWKEPNDFMMSLIKKERFLMTIWDDDNGSKLNGNLKQVGLIASPSGRDKGYISIEYSFSNSKMCDQEIAVQEDGAL